jgi:hypothetical protein
MNTLTHSQVQRLSPEEQHNFALLEIQGVRKRRQLLEKARHYPGQRWLPALVPGILFLLTIWMSERWLPVCIICLVSSLWLLIQFHATGVNRRLDALMELLDPNKKKDDGAAA